MTRYSLFYTALVAGLLTTAVLTVPIAAINAQTGSTVTVPTTGVMLYVDSSFTGVTVDGPGGTYKTIQAAINHAMYQNRSNNNVRVLIKKGNGYRESVSIDDSTNRTTKTISLEAFDVNNKPTIYGSDNWNGSTFGLSTNLFNGKKVYYRYVGTPKGVQPDIWANPGDPTVDPFTMPLVVRRAEVMIVRYGTQVVTMKRVLTYGELDYGCFYVNETASESGYGSAFFILPAGAPSGTSINQVSAEYGVRPTILTASNRESLILKNLNFQTAADYFSGAVRLNTCTNVRVEGCSMNYNGGKGIELYNDTNVTVTGCNFNSNGIGGVSAALVKNLLMQNTNGLYNNWRGAQGGLNYWDSAGIKFYKLHDAKLEYVTTNDNQGKCPGLWLDTDIKNVTVSGLTAQRNDYGLFYEAAQGPCTVNTAANGTKSTITNNRFVGLLHASGDGLIVDGSLIGNNGGSAGPNTENAQVHVRSVAAGRKYQDFELLRTNPNTPIQTVYGDGLIIKNSKIYWNLDTNWHALWANGADLSGYQRTLRSFRANNNQYWHKDPNGPWVFQRFDGSYTNGVLTNWIADLGVAANNTTGTNRESGSIYSIVP
jgi:parallel beta-helix repeat protein